MNMAIPITGLTRRKAALPPRVLIYGPPGVGKTTLASEFPDPVFLQVEDGTPGDLELETVGGEDADGLLTSYDEVIDSLEWLYSQEHDRKTVVLDSVSALERLVWAETGRRGDDKGVKKNRIEDFGYGKGYVYALNVWQEVLDRLNALRRDVGMTIVLIGHSKVKRFDDPDTVSYSRHEIDLHEKIAEPMNREMDAILCIKHDVTIKEEEQGFNKTRTRAAGGLARWIWCASRPSHLAKNRYSMPEKLLYKKGEGYAALESFFPQSQVKPVTKATKKAA